MSFLRHNREEKTVVTNFPFSSAACGANSLKERVHPENENYNNKKKLTPNLSKSTDTLQ